MSSPHTSNSPAIYSGPFSGARPLGIDRANYIAVHSSDPAAAARYAADHMGFYLVHVDGDGRHYLGAHGLDPYSLVYTPGQVQPKYLINSDNFKPGYVTPDDQWENRMRLPGQNTLLGWAPNLPGRGAGAKSLGEELANSEAFAQCQVDKVFRTVCFRSPEDAADRAKRDQIVAAFKGSNYNMKTVFAETAAHCAGN